MQTKRWKIDSSQEINLSIITEAINFLRQGEVVAFPTETVYGLGADAKTEEAVRKIFRAKGRPADNPLIAHVSTKKMLESLVLEKPSYVDDLIKTFSPGPLTYVLKSNGRCAKSVTAGLPTVAVRMPNHPIALALIDHFNGPIAAPSANTSGRPSPVTAEHVYRDLAGKIPGIIDAGPTGVGVESTVIDCTGDIPIILRPGAITEEEIASVVGDVHPSPKEQTRSDKYKHYKPEIPLWLVGLSDKEIERLIKEQESKGNRIGLLGRDDFVRRFKGEDSFSLGEDLQEIAKNLYAGFRYFDKETVDLVLCEAFPKEGLGKTIMNRIEQAASKTIE